MRVAFKIVCRAIGLLNLGFCAFGTFATLGGVALTISGGMIQETGQKHPGMGPLLGIAYAVGTVLGILLVAALMLTAIKLIRLSCDAVTSYCAVVGICLLCWFISEALSFLTGPSRVFFAVMAFANVGVFEFLFPPKLDWYLLWRLPVYPILSALLLFLMQKQLNTLHNASPAVDIPLSS